MRGEPTLAFSCNGPTTGQLAHPCGRQVSIAFATAVSSSGSPDDEANRTGGVPGQACEALTAVRLAWIVDRMDGARRGACVTTPVVRNVYGRRWCGTDKNDRRRIVAGMLTIWRRMPERHHRCPRVWKTRATRLKDTGLSPHSTRVVAVAALSASSRARLCSATGTCCGKPRRFGYLP